MPGVIWSCVTPGSCFTCSRHPVSCLTQVIRDLRACQYGEQLTHRLCVTGDCCPLETAALCSEPWPGSLSPESSRGWQGLWLFLCLQPHLWLLFLPGAPCTQPSLLFPDHSLPLLPPGPLHLLLTLALGGSDSGDPCDTPEMPDP